MRLENVALVIILRNTKRQIFRKDHLSANDMRTERPNKLTTCGV